MAKGEGHNVWWIALIVSVLLVCSFAIYKGTSQLTRAQEELDQVRATNQRLDQENRSLYRQVQRLRSDNQALERVARREMGLVRSGEVVYQKPSKETKPENKERLP